MSRNDSLPNVPIDPSPEFSTIGHQALRKGVMGRIWRRTRTAAEIAFPAIPSLVFHYVDFLADQFAAMGRPFSTAELNELSRLLLLKANEGFDKSPNANVLVRYQTSNDGSLHVHYQVAASTWSSESEYEKWTVNRTGPLFGKSADARLITALTALTTPLTCLDIGAGNGRNALEMARRGHRVWAVEIAPALSEQLESSAKEENLPVHVVTQNLLNADLPIDSESVHIAHVAQVTSHFRTVEDLKKLFTELARVLAPGGKALVSVFLTEPGEHPDRAAQQAAQYLWSTFYTPQELQSALADLPLTLRSNENALAYEREHLPNESWPPTDWFEEWAQGVDVFGTTEKPVISLRWIELERAAHCSS
ncbi:MAG: class I SAM-dependent methyltransferase [Polyangiaceae bacterium]|nr:class I SAM-dependent methyltransferase [Polyangiaceae bacterium]